VKVQGGGRGRGKQPFRGEGGVEGDALTTKRDGRACNHHDGGGEVERKQDGHGVDELEVKVR